jgi:MFS family permease
MRVVGATGTGWRDLRPPVRAAGSISGFARLSRTHALAMAGDTLVTLALAGSLFFSISPTAARGRVALSLVLTMAPFAVVAPLLGPAIDRSSRGRRAMVVLSCALRAVACVVMARVLHSLLLFPATFSVLVLSKSYAVAKSALVPATVGFHDELVEANSKLAITGVLAGFVISVPGVLLLRLVGGEWTLALAAVVFSAGAVSAFGLPDAAPADTGSVRIHPSPAREDPHRTKESLDVVAAAAVMALLRAVVGFVTFLVAFGFRHLGAPSWWFGVVLAASMAATLAGSAVAPHLRRRAHEERILTVCLALVALAGFGFGALDGGMWAAAVAAVVGLAAGTGKLAFDSLVQREVPEQQRGRSFARFEAGFQLVWVVGALLPVVVRTPLDQGYDVLGIACLAATVAYVAVSRRLATVSAEP